MRASLLGHCVAWGRGKAIAIQLASDGGDIIINGFGEDSAIQELVDSIKESFGALWCSLWCAPHLP